MALTDYITLGRSGLRVSPLALGTMTFGTDWGWGADEAEARRMFDLYAERGGNFVDTANFYTSGSSETLLGRFMAGQRDRTVLATKYSLNLHPGDPNGGGNHRKSIVRGVEASLKRLATDYIDLRYLHIWADTTPVEEVTTWCAPARSSMRVSLTRRPGRWRACRPWPTCAAGRR